MLSDALSLIYYGAISWVGWFVVYLPVSALLFWLVYKSMNREVNGSWVWGLALVMALAVSSVATVLTVLPEIAQNGLEVGITPINSDTVNALPWESVEKRFIILANQQKIGNFDLIDDQDESNRQLARVVLAGESGSDTLERLENRSRDDWAQYPALEKACANLHREYLKAHYKESPLNGITEQNAALWLVLSAVLCVVICMVHGYSSIKLIPVSGENIPKSAIARATLRNLRQK